MDGRAGGWGAEATAREWRTSPSLLASGYILGGGGGVLRAGASEHAMRLGTQRTASVRRLQPATLNSSTRLGREAWSRKGLARALIPTSVSLSKGRESERF